MKRLLWALASAGLLALLVPATASADTLTLVTIDCGDGYPLTATVDLPTLTELEASVQAIIDNPSGLTCSLSTSPVLGSVTGLTAFETTASSGFLLDRAAEWLPVTGTGSSNSVDATTGPRFFFLDTASASGSTMYVVGGGTYNYGNGCEASFGISAHMDDSQLPRGSQAFTATQDPSCAGHIQASVTCLAVDQPNRTAEIGGDITAASGADASFADQAHTFFTDVGDNGSPGTNDRAFQPPPFLKVQKSSCDFTNASPFNTHPLDSGNITVRPLPTTSST